MAPSNNNTRRTSHNTPGMRWSQPSSSSFPLQRVTCHQPQQQTFGTGTTESDLRRQHERQQRNVLPQPRHPQLGRSPPAHANPPPQVQVQVQPLQPFLHVHHSPTRTRTHVNAHVNAHVASNPHPSPRSLKNHTVAWCGDGRLYCFGGYDGRTNHAALSVFDPRRPGDGWIPAQRVQGTTPPGRNGHTATVVVDCPGDPMNGSSRRSGSRSRMVVLGGWLGAHRSGAADDVHVLQVVSKKGKSNATAGSHHDNEDDDDDDEVELEWIHPEVEGNGPGPCNMHSADYLPYRGEIYVFRGGNGREYLNDLHALRVVPTVSSSSSLSLEKGDDNDNYDIDNDEQKHITYRWRTVECRGRPPQRRANHSSALVHNGRILVVFGGWNGTQRLGDLHILHTETSTWTTPRLGAHTAVPPPRAGTTLTALRDDVLYLFGGSGTSTSARNALDDLYRLDASSGIWEEMAWTEVVCRDDDDDDDEEDSNHLASANDDGCDANPNDDSIRPTATVYGRGPGHRAGHAACAVNGRWLYVIGGSSSSSSSTSSNNHAPQNLSMRSNNHNNNNNNNKANHPHVPLPTDCHVLDTDPAPRIRIRTRDHPRRRLDNFLLGEDGRRSFCDVRFLLWEETNLPSDANGGVTDVTKKRRAVYAHRLVLSAASEPFRAMFAPDNFREGCTCTSMSTDHVVSSTPGDRDDNQWDRDHDRNRLDHEPMLEVPISHCSHRAFQTMIDYLYTGTLGERNDGHGSPSVSSSSSLTFLPSGDVNVDVNVDVDNNLDVNVGLLLELLELSDRFFLDHLRQLCERTLGPTVNEWNVHEIMHVADKANASNLRELCRHFIRNHHHPNG